MAFFMDGFDYYTSPGAVWDSASGGTISAVGAGVFGYGRKLNVNTAQTLLLTFSAVPGGGAGQWATILGGFHFRFTALGDDSRQFIALRDGATNQINLRQTAGGIFKLYRNTTLLATGATALAINTWYWLGFKAVISDAAGIFQLYLSGPGVNVLEFDLSALDTQNTANAYATTLALRTVHSSAGAMDFDNGHVYDGTDAAPWNAYSTERRIYYFLPDADGSDTDWAASAGSPYECVDENPPNSDTDYISSATATDRASFTVPALSDATIDAVKMSMFAYRDDAGPRGVKLYAKISAADYDGSESLLGAAYQYFGRYMLTSPATAGNWGLTEFNNAEWGVLLST